MFQSCKLWKWALVTTLNSRHHARHFTYLHSASPSSTNIETCRQKATTWPLDFSGPLPRFAHPAVGVHHPPWIGVSSWQNSTLDRAGLSTSLRQIGEAYSKFTWETEVKLRKCLKWISKSYRSYCSQSAPNQFHTQHKFLKTKTWINFWFSIPRRANWDHRTWGITSDGDMFETQTIEPARPAREDWTETSWREPTTAFRGCLISKNEHLARWIR